MTVAFFAAVTVHHHRLFLLRILIFCRALLTAGYSGCTFSDAAARLPILFYSEPVYNDATIEPISQNRLFGKVHLTG